MARYSSYASIAAAANKPFSYVNSDGSAYPEIYAIDGGFEGTPADEHYVLGLYENTDAGSGGTSVTPQKIGHGATASCTVKRGTFSADPTLTGNVQVVIACYRRAARAILRAIGNGFSPQTLASARGLSLWTLAAGGSGTMHWTMAWQE